MPNGRTHSIATLAAAGLMAAGAPALAYSLGLDMLDSLGAPIGAVIGLVINPDLDLAENGTISHKIVRRHLGCGPALLWHLIWWPYGALAEHRGFSHFPVLSTLLRIGYILGILALLSLLLGLAGEDLRFAEWVVYFWGYHAVRWGIAGLIVVDLIHIGMDAVTEVV